ncbi:MAG: hypothetical protein ACE5IR_18415 [bacterium]
MHEDLLSYLLNYSNTLAIFIALITVIVTLIALVKEQRLHAFLTIRIATIRLPGLNKLHTIRLTIQTLMKLCVLVSALASFTLLGLFISLFFRLQVNELLIKNAIAAAQIFSLFLFFAITFYIPIVIFEIGRSKKDPEDYSPDLEI